MKHLMETLLISERYHGLRRKRKICFKSKAVNNQLLLSKACSRALGQPERELLRQKDVSETQVSDWRLTYLSVWRARGHERPRCSSFVLALWQFSFWKDNGLKKKKPKKQNCGFLEKI